MRDRRFGTLAAIFGLALVVRCVHLALASHAPFFDLRLGDGLVYDRWARSIAGGDLIGRTVFYQAPLYPYLLALLYATVGDSAGTVRFAQAILSAASCVFVADAAWRLFSKRTGIAAGLLLAFYPPSIFLDGLLQKSALDALLVALVVWLVALMTDAPLRRTAIATGAMLGLLSLTRENAIVLAVPVLLWTLVRRDVAWSTRARTAALIAGSAAVVLAPVAARNARLGGVLAVTTTQFGPNVYIGNNPSADGTYRALTPWRGSAEFEQQDAAALAERAVGRNLTSGEVSRYYTRQAVAFVAHEPTRWIALEWRKLRLALNANEVADTEDQYTWAEWSWPLRLGAIWNFGLLLPLACAGMWLTRNEWRRIWVFHAMAVAYLASLLLFYVFARYRYPLVPILIVFAGAAVTGARSFARAATRYELVGCCAAVVLLWMFCEWPFGPGRTAQQAVTHYNIGTGLVAEGDRALAIAEFRAATRLDPALGLAQYQLGVTLAADGDLRGAAAALTEAVARAPHYAPAHNNLGVVLGRQGRAADAEREFRTAITVDPNYAPAHVNLGQMLAFDNRRQDAAAEFERALAIDPTSSAARQALDALWQR